MKRSAIVAANASPLVGGQGVNLYQVVEGLAPIAKLEVFAAAGGLCAPTRIVPRSMLADLMRGTPVVRQARDWAAMMEDHHFDSWVARHMVLAQWFHGVTGQCTRSLDVARSLGMATIVDVITAHVDDLVQRSAPEYERFGVRFPIHQAALGRMRQEYAGADRIRVMSTFAHSSFLAHGFPADRVHVVPPPLTLERIVLTTRPRRFTVGFVGALEPLKGAHYLVEAFGRIAGSDWGLRLVGGSVARPIARYTRQIISRDPRIQVGPANVRRPGFEHVYGRFSVLVHPSVCDGFGQSVAEAMSSGVPVIVTATTGAADLVEDGKSGFVIPPHDPDAIADRLMRLASDGTLCESMGREARAAVLTHTGERFRSQYAAMLSGDIPAP